MKAGKLRKSKVLKLYSFDDRPVWYDRCGHFVIGEKPTETKSYIHWEHVNRLADYLPTEADRLKSQGWYQKKIGVGVKWVLTDEEVEYFNLYF